MFSNLQKGNPVQKIRQSTFLSPNGAALRWPDSDVIYQKLGTLFAQYVFWGSK